MCSLNVVIQARLYVCVNKRNTDVKLALKQDLTLCVDVCHS